MDEQTCPRCKTSKYWNQNLKLMVNVCGHTLCESCVDLLFLKGSGSCPQCQTTLRRTNFRVQQFEDPMVEKEVDIRKRILRDYNKKEEDFETLREYNDYLEEVETIIYNLANNIDIVETNKRIEQYKRENRDQIAKNKMRVGKREHELEELLENEKQIEEERRLELARRELESQKNKLRVKEALIDELMFSEGDAKNIVQTFASVMQATKEEEKIVPVVKVSQFSTGIKFGQQGSNTFLPVPKQEEGPAFVYVPIVQDMDGPIPPTLKELETKGYMDKVETEKPEERAGGFLAQIGCIRNLQEAMAGLYHSPCNPQTQVAI